MAAEANPAPSRVALITGAGRGIGREIALGLSAAGLSVGLLGLSLSGLDATAAEMTGEVVVAVADVRKDDEVESAVATVEARLGGIDLVINNAGIIEADEVPIWEADPDFWWNVVETDLRGPFNVVRAVIPGMLDRGGGRVVDLNSGSGADDRREYSAYCAAKAALFRLAGNTHLAGYARGLRHFEVAPGVVYTSMTASMALHRGRTQWTDPRRVVNLVVAIAEGRLDAYSGRFLHAGVDHADGLEAAAAIGLHPSARRLVVRPYGPNDPLA